MAVDTPPGVSASPAVTAKERAVFEILPRVGAGAIRLGMTRSEARRLLGEPFWSYPKTPGERLTDTYFANDLQLAYDTEDRVEYIEINGPGEIDATFHGRSLLNESADRVIEWMARFAPYDPADPELGYSYVYPDLDLSVWRPVVPEGPDDEEGRYFQSVGVARPGYYGNNRFS